jgi:uncharacterized protein (TIGR03067 family)
MGLWSGLKHLWQRLWYGSGYGIDELARRLSWDAAELCSLQPRYQEFTIPKRSGGQRRLSAPDDLLKTLQRQILHRLLRRLRCHPAATGFQQGESIVTNARRHAGQAVVVRLDLKDFFPSTGEGRVRRYFRKIGWNRPAARLLTRLCTHDGGLPQGAPTSPRLSNLVNYRLDCRLAALAQKLGVGYTRYADDITLSFPTDDRSLIRYLIRCTRRVAGAEGYRLHGRKKLHIRRQHQQQRVTGLVVNQGVHLPRTTRRWLRAVEHHLRTRGSATLTPEQLAGWRALQLMVATQAVDPIQAENLRKEREDFQGAWKFLAAEEKGKPIPGEQLQEGIADRTWVFCEDKLLLPAGDTQVQATCRLDPFTNPKTIDLTPTNGPDMGKTIRGIYVLEKDGFTLCLNRRDGKRPTEFTTAPDSGQTILLFQRAKP